MCSPTRMDTTVRYLARRDAAGVISRRSCLVRENRGGSVWRWRDRRRCRERCWRACRIGTEGGRTCADARCGLPASSYVTTQQLAARNVVAAPSTTVIAAGGAPTPSIAASSTPGVTLGDESAAATQSVTQAAVTGTGSANYLPLWTSGTNLGVSRIYQAAGGFIGINTNTPLLQLDVNGNSIFRGSFQMAPQGVVATAAAGQPSHSFQWSRRHFTTAAKKAAVNEAFGFRTVPATNNVAGPKAKLDLFYGPGGGTLNDTGLSINSTGQIHVCSGTGFYRRVRDGKPTLNLPDTTSPSIGVLTMRRITISYGLRLARKRLPGIRRGRRLHGFGNLQRRNWF